MAMIGARHHAVCPLAALCTALQAMESYQQLSSAPTQGEEGVADPIPPGLRKAIATYEAGKWARAQCLHLNPCWAGECCPSSQQSGGDLGISLY